MGTAARGKFANNLDGMRSAISRQLKQMAEDGGTKKSDHENENDLVLESTFDGAGDDLDAMSGSDYDHEAGTDGSYGNEIEEHLYDENETEKDIDSRLHGFNRGHTYIISSKDEGLASSVDGDNFDGSPGVQRFEKKIPREVWAFATRSKKN